VALLFRFRRRVDTAVPPERLPGLIRRWLAAWPQLELFEQDHLTELTGEMVRSLRWEASRGFAITDDMRVAVAAHAALLVLGFDNGLESYHDVSSVIIHPSTIVRRGTRSLGFADLHTDDPEPIIGEAHHRGPVLVSWDSAAFQARAPQLGENVLFHEFAHRLDMLDGVSDGTPFLADQAALDQWVEICTESYERLRNGGQGDGGQGDGGQASVLRPYAATNPSEFFAVATEVFFTIPTALRDAEPELYDVLRSYFRQDPSAR